MPFLHRLPVFMLLVILVGVQVALKHELSRQEGLSIETSLLKVVFVSVSLLKNTLDDALPLRQDCFILFYCLNEFLAASSICASLQLAGHGLVQASIVLLDHQLITHKGLIVLKSPLGVAASHLSHCAV